MSTPPSEDRSEAPGCIECDRGVEWCSLCGEEACPACLCYRCAGLALKELTPLPHPHGG